MRFFQEAGRRRSQVLLIVLTAIAGGFLPSELRAEPGAVAQTQSVTQVWGQTSQGQKLTINGRSRSVSWTQWRDQGGLRTGITDFGLVQAIGVELLNTNDPSRQPVQWFSQPTTQPIVLPTRLIGNLRYLDLTDFAKQLGWQLQVQGVALEITTPPARVLDVRRTKQAQGDRVVIELDRPAPRQIEFEPSESGATVIVNAQAEPALLNRVKPDLGTIQISSENNQLRLRLGQELGPTVRFWSLSNPNRLILDRVSKNIPTTQQIQWAPGLRWHTQAIAVGTTLFPVTWLEIDPRQPGITLKPILPNPNNLQGIASLAQTAQTAQAVAAINGGFFNRNNQFPLGAVRRDDRWYSGPILGRGAIAWNAAGELLFDRLTLQETLRLATGESIALTHLNSAYLQPGIARYTAAWGPSYTPFTDRETVFTVENDRITRQQTIDPRQSVAIPTSGYVLVVRSTLASPLTVGGVLRLESQTNPPEFQRYPQILGAGPLLLKNGQIVLDAQAEKFSRAFASERASRSAIGRTATGMLLLVAVHPRSDGTGISLIEVAQLMQQLGSIAALNLDGGSSTSLYLGGQGIDRPGNTTSRIHTAIGVFVQPN